jgi:signal peptidase
VKAPAGTTLRRSAPVRPRARRAVRSNSAVSQLREAPLPHPAKGWASFRQEVTAFYTAVRRPLAIARDLAVFVAVLAVALAVVASLGPRLYGYSPVIVYGGSMADTVPVGSIAVTKEVQAEDVAVGDIIVFYPPATEPNHLPLMHRVISIQEENGQRVFRTKGDANAAPDPWEMTLVGHGSRFVYAVPYAGYLADFAKTPLGWTLLLLLPASYLGLTALKRIWAGDRTAR